MQRRVRTEILIKGSKEISKKLSEEVNNNYSIKVLEAPNHGLVMVKSRESGQNTLFYLGEVFVTECKVSVNGAIGLGLVQGDNETLAYDLAVIDAAYNGNLGEVKSWDEILYKESVEILNKLNEESKQILGTKVDFSTMDVEL